MIKFTKEEISLCKQVAKRHRKEVEEGSYLSFIDKIWLVYHITGPWISTISNGAKHTISTNLDNQDEWFPLWTISDCLEFLEEEGFTYTLHFITKKRGYELILFNGHQKKSRIFEGETRKIAYLKPVLAVLEDRK